VAGQEEPGKLGLACGWLGALAREITDWPDPGQPVLVRKHISF